VSVTVIHDQLVYSWSITSERLILRTVNVLA